MDAAPSSGGGANRRGTVAKPQTVGEKGTAQVKSLRTGRPLWDRPSADPEAGGRARPYLRRPRCRAPPPLGDPLRDLWKEVTFYDGFRDAIKARFQIRDLSDLESILDGDRDTVVVLSSDAPSGFIGWKIRLNPKVIQRLCSDLSRSAVSPGTAAERGESASGERPGATDLRRLRFCGAWRSRSWGCGGDDPGGDAQRGPLARATADDSSAGSGIGCGNLSDRRSLPSQPCALQPCEDPRPCNRVLSELLTRFYEEGGPEAKQTLGMWIFRAASDELAAAAARGVNLSRFLIQTASPLDYRKVRRDLGIIDDLAKSSFAELVLRAVNYIATGRPHLPSDTDA